MTHTSTEQPEALRLAKELRYCKVMFIPEVASDFESAAALLERLNARVQELEEDLQLARQGIGAEAYDMACEEMEAYQLKRAKAGKEAGTTLSLVDGMAWVYERLDELEAQVQRAPLTDAQIKEGRNAVNDDPDDRPEPWAFREGVKFAERMHGITQEKQG